MEQEKKEAEAALLERPICCEFVPSRGMFRVSRAKGKALASGGFGVAIAEETDNQEATKKDNPTKEDSLDSGASSNGNGNGNEKTITQKAKPAAFKESLEFLFIEEVIFLHERGLLWCLPPGSSESTSSTPLDSSQLYQLLPKLGMSLLMYFVYAHLQSQDFRVLRHAPGRLQLLQQQQDEGTLSRREVTALRHQVRASIQNALPPVIPDAGVHICWDAYQPNSNFGKTHPGLPDFSVAVTYYNQPHAAFSDIQNALQTHCQGTPLKLATVSDSGTVVMFGVTNFGVPPIAKTESS